jgi:TetR/AcrR family transcriptional regulator
MRRERLPASERRAAVIDTAGRVFSRCSYRGATTAEIAREAGVTEPILYRHFESKQALYLACIDDAWARVREAWERAVASEPDPRAWIPAMGRAFFEFREQKAVVANLWMQALTESGDEPEVRKFLRRHLRDVHEFVVDVVRRSQEAGAVPADRDPRAEAWIFVAIGLLVAVAGRLGGLPQGDLERIRASRRTWLTGATGAEQPSD